MIITQSGLGLAQGHTVGQHLDPHDLSVVDQSTESTASHTLEIALAL